MDQAVGRALHHQPSLRAGRAFPRALKSPPVDFLYLFSPPFSRGAPQQDVGVESEHNRLPAGSRKRPPEAWSGRKAIRITHERVSPSPCWLAKFHPFWSGMNFWLRLPSISRSESPAACTVALFGSSPVRHCSARVDGSGSRRRRPHPTDTSSHPWHSRCRENNNRDFLPFSPWRPFPLRLKPPACPTVFMPRSIRPRG